MPAAGAGAGAGAAAANKDPWSKKHKRVTRASAGGVPHSLSNSYAQPLTHPELVRLTLARGDRALVEAYDGPSGASPRSPATTLRRTPPCRLLPPGTRSSVGTGLRGRLALGGSWFRASAARFNAALRGSALVPFQTSALAAWTR